MRSVNTITRSTSILAFLAAMGVCVFAGCQREPPTGQVSGTVMFNGSPLPEGMVTFINEEGRVGTAAIKEGQYTMPKAPVGKCGIEVVVNTGQGAAAIAPVLSKRAQMAMNQAKNHGFAVPEGASAIQARSKEKLKLVQIPKKYGNSATSGLSLTVVRGEQKFDIPLQP